MSFFSLLLCLFLIHIIIVPAIVIPIVVVTSKKRAENIVRKTIILPKPCTRCGQPVPPGSPICVICGAPVSDQ